MKISLALTLLSASTAWSRSLPQRPDQQTLSAPDTDSVFRDLLTSDMPAVTSLIMAAFSPGPVYQYLAPDLDSHKEAFWQCMNASMTKSWETRNRLTTFGRVITVNDKPVSVSTWKARTKGEEDFFASSLVTLAEECRELPGGNATRIRGFDPQMHAIQEKHLKNAYQNQLYLNVLATHPDWNGRGFGARHLQWGKDLSSRLGGSPWPVTLLSTPSGWPVYKSSGFEDIANVTIRKLDGLGELWFEVMRWQA